MTSGGKPGARRITLEELIALNDEMAALVRAGVPLERGLSALGGELPGTPGRLARLLAGRMDAGESLAQILAGDDETFPPVWRAVVEAGIRSGHLAAALESLSATARRTAELRRLVGAGVVYPLIVLGMAYVVFVFLVLRIMPGMAAAHADLAGGVDTVTATLDWLGGHAAWWVIPVPVVVAVLLAVWWRRSARAVWSGRLDVPSDSRRRGRRAFFGRPSRQAFGGFRQALRNGRMATFAEVLSLLVGQKVPLGDSVTLAAEASGDRTLAAASRTIADRLRRGEVLERREDLPGGFPPMLGWLLLSGGREAGLGEALSRSAAVYRQRAARAANWTAVYLPISLTVLVGGTATLLCALTAFLPIARLLFDLSAP